MKKILLLGALVLAATTSKAEDLMEGYLTRTNWSATSCSWIQDTNTCGPLSCMFDDDMTTYFHQNWSEDKADGTHWLIVDLGKEETINGIDIWGRPDQVNGHILEGKLYASATPFTAFADHAAAKAWYDNADNVPVGEIHYQYAEATRGDVRSVRFDEMTARYILLVTDQTKNNHLCISELQVQGKIPPRVDINHSDWTVTTCSVRDDEGPVANMFDDNKDTYFHQNWGNDKALDTYHWMMFDLGKEEHVDGFKYWRRKNNTNGQFLTGKVYVSNDPFTAFTTHNGDENAAKAYYEDATNVAAGQFSFNYDKNPESVRICDFTKRATGRYVLIILSEAGANDVGRHLCCSEFRLFTLLTAADLANMYEESIDATLLERAGNLAALGSFIGKGGVPEVVAPADITIANFNEKVEAGNASIQSYIDSFNEQLIYIRHASRRQNAYLTVAPKGNDVRINTSVQPTADAVWQVRLLDNNTGFQLYSRTAGMWFSTSNGTPIMQANIAEVLTSQLSADGNLRIIKAADGKGINVDTYTNDLVWYGAGDAGSQWTASATSLDEQVFAEPEVSTAAAPKYYRLMNARSMYDKAASNMAVNGENQDGDGNGETITRSNASIPGVYWRLETSGDGVKLINLTGYEFTIPEAAKALVTATDNGSTIYVIKQTHNQFHGVNAYAISQTAEQGDATCLDVSGNNAGKICWSPSRESNGNGNNGSAWYFLLASDNEVANATAAYVEAVKDRMILANGQLAELLGQEAYEATTEYSYAGESTVAALNAAKASGNYAKVDSIYNAIDSIVSANVSALANRHFLVHNRNANYSNCYLTVSEDHTAPTSDASDVNAVWSFVPSGAGYLMTSAATGNSLSYTTGTSQAIPVVEEGLPYSIGYNSRLHAFNFTLVPTDDVTNVSYYALHQGGNSLVCKWIANNIEGSHWTLELLSEADVEINPVIETNGHRITLPEGVELNDHESAAGHQMTITRIVDVEAAAARRVAPVDGVHTITATDFDENKSVELEGLEEGKYKIEAPAGMFLVNGKSSAAVSRSFTVHSDGSTTGVKEISAEAANGVQVIFDLQGRRLSAPIKGVNIINGKKVLVK